MNTAILMLLVFVGAVVLSWLLTKRIVVRFNKNMDPTESLLLGVCVFAAMFFVVAGIAIGAASVYRQFAREVGSAISETADAFEEARSGTEETAAREKTTEEMIAPETTSMEMIAPETTTEKTVDVAEQVSGAGSKATNEAAQITMFDGKTLKGWRADRYPEIWTIVQGTIVAKADANRNRSHLIYNTAFVDFEFEGEVKISGGNSGLHFRATQEGDTIDGYEVQIVSEADKRQITGSLYHHPEATITKNVVKDNKWFKLRVTAKENQITIALDDETVLEYTDKENKYRAGYFALQCWAPETEVHFRNLRVRALQ